MVLLFKSKSSTKFWHDGVKIRGIACRPQLRYPHLGTLAREDNI